MSYIIAFVSFSESSKEFPVQCFRTDLKAGDEVIVRRGDGKLRFARIAQLRYLNWDCNGRIECRREEIALDYSGNIVLPKKSPVHIGVSTPYAFAKSLKDLGWMSCKLRNKMYRAAFAKTNDANVAYILHRKNGIDIQIISKKEHGEVTSYGFYDKTLHDGEVVRHSLPHTKFNLFEGVLRFAKSFSSNEEDLSRYFVPQGSADKRTEELKSKAKKLDSYDNEMQDIYDACSDGAGGPAYLGDGMWIGSEGKLYDWGR
ncbi:hypothetical protein R1T44_11050 [Cobetia amphilecti]|uniref:hypothetical protein n=2 Tax=Cobetia TaxID=204286 RepID=UPI002943BE27|nr:hypothetical protein [Cobetia amphilecti]WOI24691.1 hypothetical protein R1T44_11050 [Cobetia amphilecti]